MNKSWHFLTDHIFIHYMLNVLQVLPKLPSAYRLHLFPTEADLYIEITYSSIILRKADYKIMSEAITQYFCEHIHV